MFCNKCGKQLPDNAVFCSGCGNQVGAAAQGAPAAPQAAATGELPLILKRLINQVVGFFTRKDPIGVVTASAHDKTWSGAILALFGAIMMALGAMVNVNQGFVAAAKEIYSDYWGKEMAKELAKNYPSGVTFLMSLLGAVVVFAVAVALVFVVTTKICKKPLSLAGACNIVAYASIPMICVSIINMLAGLIWFVLPVVFMLLAGVATLILIAAATNKACELEKPSFKVNMILFGVLAFVALIFTWLTLKTVNADEDAANVILSIIRLWLPID